MSATHHSLPTTTRRPGSAPQATDRFDWRAQVRLGLVLSVVAVIVTVGLAGRVADPVLVIGLFAVASVLAWRRVPALTPVRVHRR